MHILVQYTHESNLRFNFFSPLFFISIYIFCGIGRLRHLFEQSPHAKSSCEQTCVHRPHKQQTSWTFAFRPKSGQRLAGGFQFICQQRLPLSVKIDGWTCGRPQWRQPQQRQCLASQRTFLFCRPLTYPQSSVVVQFCRRIMPRFFGHCQSFLRDRWYHHRFDRDQGSVVLFDAYFHYDVLGPESETEPVASVDAPGKQPPDLIAAESMTTFWYLWKQSWLPSPVLTPASSTNETNEQ